MAVLVATGAGVRHHRRWFVRGLDLEVGAGRTVAVTGPPGSGRTSTLLALAGRLRLTEGTIRISGTAVLGHVPGVEEPEPVFTVREHVRERLALLGRPRRETATVPLYGLDPDLRGRALSPYQRHLLGLTLSLIGEPTVIALDGVDNGLDTTERDSLWRLLTEIAAAGVTVLVTAREIDPSRADHEIRLSDPRSGEPGRPTVLSTPRDESPAHPSALAPALALVPAPAPAPDPVLDPGPVPASVSDLVPELAFAPARDEMGGDEADVEVPDDGGAAPVVPPTDEQPTVDLAARPEPGMDGVVEEEPEPADHLAARPESEVEGVVGEEPEPVDDLAARPESGVDGVVGEGPETVRGGVGAEGEVGER